jgi:hypothetical protein
MDVKEAIKSQYLASLEMLRQTIAKCPESVWDDPEHKNRFWHIAYHVLFYTHLYLQEAEKDFAPWAKHRSQYHLLGPTPWPPYSEPEIGDPYNQAEILEYLALCQQQVEEKVASLDPDAESGFDWLPFSKLELHVYNIRHIQHHVGELTGRLGAKEAIEVEWVGMKPGNLA